MLIRTVLRYTEDSNRRSLVQLSLKSCDRPLPIFSDNLFYMPDKQKIWLFWQAYLATLPEHHPHRFNPLPDAWSFGNNAQIADKLGNLVAKGIKRNNQANSQNITILNP